MLFSGCFTSFNPLLSVIILKAMMLKFPLSLFNQSVSDSLVSKATITRRMAYHIWDLRRKKTALPCSGRMTHTEGLSI